MGTSAAVVVVGGGVVGAAVVGVVVVGAAVALAQERSSSFSSWATAKESAKESPKESKKETTPVLCRGSVRVLAPHRVETCPLADEAVGALTLADVGCAQASGCSCASSAEMLRCFSDISCFHYLTFIDVSKASSMWCNPADKSRSVIALILLLCSLKNDREWKFQEALATLSTYSSSLAIPSPLSTTIFSQPIPTRYFL